MQCDEPCNTGFVFALNERQPWGMQNYKEYTYLSITAIKCERKNISGTAF